VTWTEYLRQLVVAPTALDYYEYSHQKLTFRGRRRKLLHPKPTVSSFADWVYDLAHDDVPPEVREAQRELGAEGEAWIERQRKTIPPAQVPFGWTLEFADPLDGSAPAFTISSLTLKGQPLRGRPDLVFRNGSGDIAIVERKVTRAREVPLQGWPNLRAQLWCYSLIDRWKDAREVYLFGEIWQWVGGEPQLDDAYPRWRRSNSKLQRECEELFRIWGGRVEAAHPV
jgi:hypothetical protein